ncbi:PREDICTED: probable calcium-binding protein CML45 [Tarenaya hassleriana]|uniref:probable calcium-binding protein CML45 n=1 Tax=Tarenaya hassleriana TaxID=28532 RepID=UPI00053C453A|nr:PREDICTED: probable calcium-binding protein CML45 [Tarenaya hassleriana]
MYVCIYIHPQPNHLYSTSPAKPVSSLLKPFIFSSSSALEEQSMPVNQLHCFLAMDKASSSSGCEESSLPLFGLLDFFLIGFFRWVLIAQSFLSRFWPLTQQQSVTQKKNKELEFKKQQSLSKHEDELSREDVEMVMKSLGLFSEQDHGQGLQERYGSKEVLSLFEEKEPSFEEVKQAFDVFDENRDGFIDAPELQRVLTAIGLKEGSNLENCRKMIRSLDGNKDERIDFHEFVKFMENRFC